MTALKIIAAVLLVLGLISQIRVGGVAEYSAEGLLVRLRVWFLRITLYPMEEKPAKEKKPKQERPPKEKQGGTLQLIRAFIPLAAEAAGKLLRKIRIDELVLHLTWASPDPAKTAMGYGAANALMGMLLPPLEYNFKVKEWDIGIALDFQRTEPVLYLRASLSMTVGQLLSFVLIYGVKAGKLYLNTRPPRQKAECKVKSPSNEGAE